MLVPARVAFHQAAEQWSGFDSLFDLVSRYDVRSMRNLQRQQAPQKSGRSCAAATWLLITAQIGWSWVRTCRSAKRTKSNWVSNLLVAFFGWSLGEVMVLYWCESAIIGIYNLARIVAISRWVALITGTFFLAHYSAFMAVHFLFIYAFFVEGPGAGGSVSSADLSQVGQMFMTLWPALLALFLSHGYSFVVNFLGRFEFESRSVNDQMMEPYKRIVFMHLVLIFGGGLTLVLGSATPVLLLVIALKIWVDVRAHIKEHAGQGR